MRGVPECLRVVVCIDVYTVYSVCIWVPMVMLKCRDL